MNPAMKNESIILKLVYRLNDKLFLKKNEWICLITTNLVSITGNINDLNVDFAKFCTLQYHKITV